ncbi:MAG TPA: DUF3604 domain-containing protein [Candidatus Binatia bacterium]|nr:DUF3604 domain-containing protein [Candidatus Binatia bacterium]
MPLGRATLVLLAVLAAPASAATVDRRLDAYALLATESLRARALRVERGDVAVDAGALLASELDAPGSQVVARAVRLRGASRCAAVIGDAVAGTGPSCPLAARAAGAVLPDVADACGYPAPFPACDRARPVTVAAGALRALAPGVYGAITVRGGRRAGVLALTGGRYVFCGLRVLRGARVLARAPVEVDVAGEALLDRGAVVGPAEDVALEAGDVRLFAGGARLRVAPRAQLRARLCAPHAALTADGATLAGVVVARRMRLVRALATAPYLEPHAACAQHDRLRNVYFGDLHVHTALSFDAYAFDVRTRTTPEQAYRFARGEPVALPPLDANGAGTQIVRLARPLDFTAVTDHSEFLGEVETCVTPGSPTYASASCQSYRAGSNAAATQLGVRLALTPPSRDPAICGADGHVCLQAAGAVWQRVQEAAEQAYDRSAACAFTTFIAYEYTGTQAVSTLHRNVIFRTDRVPAPTTFFEQPTPQGLWAELRSTCIAGLDGCDVLAIPHNSNESNGKMFLVEYPGASDVDQQRTAAELRAAMEPVVEIYQHKGDSECMNGLSGVIGAPDELCDFEKRRRPPVPDCGGGTGAGGTITAGCVSRLDFVRGALLAGLSEAARLGVNPYRLGIVASTDTHNGTPGKTDEATWVGHRGTDDDTPAFRLGPGQFYPGGILFSPGGLAGVWAEENSRPAIFDALRRREVFGTSGPRIAVRFFGGFGLSAGLCKAPDLVARAYARGVPMGGALPPRGRAAAPTFVVSALRDPEGAPLQHVQIIKGWIENGAAHEQVFEVAGDAANGASVDAPTCTPRGPGADALCGTWTDRAFRADQPAFYYARVLENPTCRWSTYQCNALAPADRPPSCSDPSVPKTIQERAWTSPIWYQPAAWR